MIDRQVRHLSSLVDDLLDVSRITQGKITLTKTPLAIRTFLSAAVEASRPLIDARKHRLEVSLPEEVLRVEGDPTRLAAGHLEPAEQRRQVHARERRTSAFPSAVTGMKR